MNVLLRFATSSIGRKQIVALTGILLCAFLAGHLGGNFLIYKGYQAFNHYAEFLEASPALPFVELALLGVFACHIAFALWVTWENLLARPEHYAVHQDAGGRTIGSSTMIYTGIFVLIFLVFHVTTFRLIKDEEGLYGLWGYVVDWFKGGLTVAFYVTALVFLGAHLSHGVQSAVQTLGVNHPRLTPSVKGAGLLFAIAMAVAFGMIPIWSHLVHGG